MSESPGTLAALYEKHKALAWALILLGPIAILAIGVVVAPTTVYDHFIWEDIWGPTLVDAKQLETMCLLPDGDTVDGPCTGGIGTESQGGYTLTSELTYGIVLAILLYGIYMGILRRFSVVTNGAFTAALIPYILMGPTVRSLEDANLFLLPGTTHEANAFAWVFISPWIYFNIAFFAIAGLLLGIFLERAAKGGADARGITIAYAAAPALFVAGYSYVFAFQGHTFHALAHPAWPFLAALAGVLYVYWHALRDNLSKNHVLFAFGLPLIAWPAALQVRWATGGAWTLTGKGIHLEAGLAITGLVLAVTASVYFIARLIARRGNRVAGLYTKPFNVALIFAHMLDGFATYVAIGDPLNLGLSGYSEKHPVSDFFLRFFEGTSLEGTPVASLMFPVVKLLMVLGIIWLLDRDFLAYEESRRKGGAPAMTVETPVEPAKPADGPDAGAGDSDPADGSPDESTTDADSPDVDAGEVDTADSADAPSADEIGQDEAPAAAVDDASEETAEEEAERMENDLNLVGLIKMAIFVLGFAPGLRDFLLVVQGF